MADSTLELLPSNGLLIIWNLLSGIDKRHLFLTSKTLQERCTPYITSIILKVCADEDGPRTGGSLNFLPRTWVEHLPHTGVRLIIEDPQHGLQFAGARAHALKVFLDTLAASPDRNILNFADELVLQNLDLDVAVAQALTRALADNTCLRSMELDKYLFMAEGKLLFSSIWPLTMLTHIRISEENVNDSWAWYVLPRMPNLTHFDMVWKVGALSPQRALFTPEVATSYHLGLPPDLLKRADIEWMCDIMPSLKSFHHNGAFLVEGAVEALLEQLPQLTSLRVRTLSPEEDLRERPCPWQTLEVRAAHFRDIALWPLASLSPSHGCFDCPMLIVEEGLKTREVTQAVDNLLRCPALTSSIVLKVFWPDCIHTSALTPLCSFRDRVQGLIFIGKGQTNILQAHARDLSLIYADSVTILGLPQLSSLDPVEGILRGFPHVKELHLDIECQAGFFVLNHPVSGSSLEQLLHHHPHISHLHLHHNYPQHHPHPPQACCRWRRLMEEFKETCPETLVSVHHQDVALEPFFLKGW